jgi:hypothetical protein
MNNHTPSYQDIFHKSLYWNALDSLGTQALFLIHYALIKSYTSASFYGYLATIFSLFYLAITILNFGLNSTLAPFFKEFTESKESFLYALRTYGVPQLIVTVCVSAVGSYLLYTYNYGSLDTTTYILLGATCITESLKKIIKSFLQYALYFHKASVVEFMGTFLYICTIWTLWFSGFYILTYTSLWLMLLCVSTIQLSLYTSYTYLFYTQLKSLPYSHQHNTHSFLTNRASSCVNQLSSQLFTSNVLVPLCTFYLGADYAGVFHLSSHIARLISLVAQKICGISALSFFAHTKNAPLAQKKSTFNMINGHMFSLVYGLIIFMSINGYRLSSLYTHTGHIVSYTTYYASFYFLIVISFLESFFMVYEKWYIAEEKAHYYLCTHVASFIAISCISLYKPYSLTLATLFISIIAIRSIALCLLSILSYMIWNIYPQYSLSYKLVILYITGSVLCNIALRYMYPVTI